MRRFVAVLGALTLFFTATGCADEATPGESVPALVKDLDRVDASVEKGDFGEARTAVEELIAEAAQARVDGEITAEQADRIFDAAQSFLDHLPPSANQRESSEDEGPDNGEDDGD
jgi:hypothetical protein